VRDSASLVQDLLRKRDFYAGGLMVLLGAGVALKGATYRAGTLMHMGPGFLPTVLGIILVLLGIAIAATGLAPTQPGSEAEESILPPDPQWWAWFFHFSLPLGANILPCGMVPATFACVFIAALGDRTATWLSTVVLSTVVTIFGVGLFSYFLQVPLPIFAWRAGL
jgi:putative Ca2+/H+ antiporter (TMEM165/GDT1 family)